MMRLFRYLVMILFVIGFVNSAEFGYNDLDGAILTPSPTIFDNNTAFVNSTDYWVTDIGPLSTVNETQLSNEGGVLTALKSWWDGLYCQLTGCTMNGDLNMSGNNITGVNNMEAESYTLNDTTITNWDEVGTNVSINFGSNESDTSGPPIPFLLTETGILKIETSGNIDNIWSQSGNEIINNIGNVLNFSGNITGNVVSWRGGYITSNSTCNYLRYNSTGTLKESDCT